MANRPSYKHLYEVTSKMLAEYQDKIVPALRKELAVALDYITALKDCDTCKHEQALRDRGECPGDCLDCDATDCICKGCYNSSKWEWKGAANE